MAPALTCQACAHLIESDLDAPHKLVHRVVTCVQPSTGAAPSSADPPAGSSSDAVTGSTAPSGTDRLVSGRRLRGVNIKLCNYKKTYSDVCTLVKSGNSLYDSLEQMKISRGTWRAIRLLAEALILYEGDFTDRLVIDDVQNQKGALIVAKELLSLPDTRTDLLNLHREDSGKVLKPLPSYSF